MRYLIAAALLGFCTASAQADESVFNYNLKANTCKVLDLLPVHNAPIQIMGVNVPSGSPYGGVGEVTLTWFINFDGEGVNFFEWVGADGTGTLNGGSNKAGNHIMYLGGTFVDLQVWNENRLRVCNTLDVQQHGTLTMMWGSSTPHELKS